MTTVPEMKIKIGKLPVNLDRMDGIVNGPADGPASLVPTDNGPVKTIARVVAENTVVLGEATAEIEAAKDAAIVAVGVEVQAAKDAALVEIGGSTQKAEDWAQKPENSEVEPGAYSALHWAAKSEKSLQDIYDFAAGAPDSPAILNKAERDGGSNITDLPTWRTNLRVAEMASAENFGGNELTAAQNALAAGRPYVYRGNTGSDLEVPIDFTGCTTEAEYAARFAAALDWFNSVLTFGRRKVFLKIPDNTHMKVGTAYFQRYRQQPHLALSMSTYDLIDIVGPITQSLVAGTTNVYEVTFNVAAALPARVVPGWAVTVQGLVGDNHAEAYCGAWSPTSVAADRLSFTARRIFTIVPTPPTTITNFASGADSYSIVRSKLRIPRAMVDFSGGTASVEGWANFPDGASCEFKNFGMNYSGTSINGTVVSVNGDSRVYDESGTWAGAPERIFRGNEGGNIVCVRTGMGGVPVLRYNGGVPLGAQTANALLVEAQSDGRIDLVRCEGGGAAQACVRAGHNVRFKVAQSRLVGGSAGIVDAILARGFIYPSTLSHGAVGIRSEDSVVQIDNLTSRATIQGCTTALDWTAGGRIDGNYNENAAIPNIKSSPVPANRSYRGGGWQKNRAAIMIPTDRDILIADARMQMIRAGLLAKGGAFYVLAAKGGDRADACMNVLHPDILRLIPTGMSGGSESIVSNLPTFSDDGVVGNGTDMWLDTDTPLSAVPNYSQNSASMFVWSETNAQSTIGRDIGTASSFNASLNIRSDANTALVRANDGTTNGSAAVTDSTGLFGWSRVGSAGYKVYRNAVTLASPAVASTGIAPGDLSLLRSNTGFSARKLSYAWVGGGLTDAEVTSLHTIVSQLRSSLAAL